MAASARRSTRRHVSCLRARHPRSRHRCRTPHRYASGGRTGRRTRGELSHPRLVTLDEDNALVLRRRGDVGGGVQLGSEPLDFLFGGRGGSAARNGAARFSFWGFGGRGCHRWEQRAVAMWGRRRQNHVAGCGGVITSQRCGRVGHIHRQRACNTGPPGAFRAAHPRLHRVLHGNVCGVVLLEGLELIPAYPLVDPLLVHPALHLRVRHPEIKLVRVSGGRLLLHVVDRILRGSARSRRG
eukprot:scaffold10182_cov107-Isochrysis_galbana.AAC.2